MSVDSRINPYPNINENILEKANYIFNWCKVTGHIRKKSVVTKNAFVSGNFLDIKHSLIDGLIKDIEEEYFYFAASKTDVLSLLINFPYSINYIQVVEFFEEGEELPHHNEKTEDLTIVMGLNKWKNEFRLHLKKGSLIYPFQFEKGYSVIFKSSVARRVINRGGVGDRMLVISLKKDNSKRKENIKRSIEYHLKTKKEQDLLTKNSEKQKKNTFTSSKKFSRFWRGLKNGINIFR